MAAILGIVASLVGPATEIGKCIAAPIKRQFSYLCCFSSIVQSLREEADKLEDARAELKMRVTTAENNAEVIVRQVRTWFENVNDIQMKMREIESEIESRGLSIKSRYSISKKAKTTAQVMKELRDGSSFNHVSQLAPSASTVSVPLGTTSEFESRKHIEDGIITTLRNKNVNMLGICGMGGIGKTTMAKRIMNRVREEDLFDEIVMVVVSQLVDVLKIQDDIAESLGLTLVDRSLSSRAHKLRIRLMCEKRILIVLDDIWKNLNLDDLGIPYERNFKGCTIVLTSRDRDVLRAMSAQKVFVVATLSKVEAWSLFRENIGTSLDDHKLLSVAHKIVKECKGLPLALVTVGVALKDRREEFIWEDALQQLKSSNPIDMPNVLEDVYKPLRLSYNFLESEHAKSLFLLCCLFPEDAHIPIQHLTFYCWGLRVFEELRNMVDARNRVWMLVEMLKNRFLLLDIEMEGFVQMHDVVRDVAIFIASDRGLVPKLSLMTWKEENSYNDCTWISSFLGERAELLKEMVLPNLRLLQIDNNRGENFQMNDYFFDGIRGLNVMSIACPSLRRLPHTTHLLKKLRTLVLHRCYCLDSIFVVGELESLEILVCDNCDSIEELPAEMKRLTRLRLLELSLCWKLKTIAPGVISSLVGLEELKMVMCFDKWEPEAMKEGKERKNAGLRELQSLSHLTYLKINVEDSTLAAEEMSLSAKLVKFDIRIGNYYITDFSAERFNKRICLQLTGDISLGHWINTLLRSTECLDSTGDGSNNLELSHAQNIRWLSLKKCSTMKYIAKPVDCSFAVFPLLEWLYLQELANLEEICSGFISSDSFQNLQYLRLKSLPALKHLWKSSNPYQNGISLCSNLCSIYIYHCDSIRNLFTLSAKDCLPQLEGLVLESCEMMEQVFLWNADDNKKGVAFTFPNLKSLVLRYLPRLSVFLKGIGSVEFPQLTELLIVGCPKMKSLVSYIGHDHNTCLHLLGNPKVCTVYIQLLVFCFIRKIRTWYKFNFISFADCIW